MASLIYVADPLCSWCYGFGPQLTRLLQGLPDVPLDIVVGGLRAYNAEILDQPARDRLREHWQHVAAATGLAFNYDTLARPGLVCDTEPACRAVVAARLLVPPGTERHPVLDVFHAIQHAFYAEGREVVDGTALADIACATLHQRGIGITSATFYANWSSEATIAATRDEFIQTQRWGISGFPTLVLERNGRLDLVSSGFARTEVLVERMQELLDKVPA